MYNIEQDLTAYQADPSSYYRLLNRQLASVLEIDENPVTNMAQTSAFIMQMLPDLNWAGFYLVRGESALVLGPYQGRLACVHIPFGEGVCGAVAKSRERMMVNDVHAFPGHIACDAASNSEIVIPLVQQQRLIGVLDIDSPKQDRFTEHDLAGFSELANTVLESADWRKLSY